MTILYEERFAKRRKIFKNHIPPYVLHTQTDRRWSKNEAEKQLQQNIKKHTFIYNVLSIASKSIFLITYYIINTRKVV